MNKKIIDIIDVLFYTLFYTAQNLIRISAATPISFIFLYLAVSLDKDPAIISTLTLFQTILTTLKCSAPLILLFLPFYDYEKRRQHREHLTKIGIISYSIAWGISLISIILLPSNL